jgi:hypothetical protein
MKLLNIDQFDTSALVRPTSVVLVYYPGPDEPFINGVSNGELSHITKTYYLTNTKNVSDFSMKIFIIPHFISVAAGYQLEARLVNLERDIDIDVTNDIQIESVSGSFQPNNYGNLQELTISLKMDDIMPGVYKGYTHTQKVDVILEIPGSTGKDPFIIDYFGDRINPYGVGVKASCSPGGVGQLYIGNGMNTLNEWLSYVYNSAGILFDRTVLEEPPRPTHFRYSYKVGNKTISSPEIPVSEWDAVHDKVLGIPEWERFSTVNIVWLIDNVGEWDVLGFSPLVISLDLLD